MGILSNLQQNRLQSIIGGQSVSLPGDFTLFAIERGKRMAVDVPVASLASIVLWITVISPGSWSLVQIPLIPIAVIMVYFFAGGWV